MKYVWIGIIAGLLASGWQHWMNANAPERQIISLPATEWVCTDREPPDNHCWEYRRVAPRPVSGIPERTQTIL